MASLNDVAIKIIKKQELVIGPLAWTEAAKVRGLSIDISKGSVAISDSDPKYTVDRLVAQYERLFGRASQEVCRDAVADILKSFAPTDIPASLRA
jgi:hypothetical protein